MSNIKIDKRKSYQRLNYTVFAFENIEFIKIFVSLAGALSLKMSLYCFAANKEY
jgi:hypothetical protein